jgi:hypothetical protein
VHLGLVTATDPKRHRPADAGPEWARRRRLAEVFGDPLPDTTSDERDPGETADATERGDTWLQEQVPPHHG